MDQALESATGQTYKPAEIIVIDDGSCDNSASQIKQYQDSVKYVYQSKQGAAAARNRGVRLSRGDYLAFLDADDLWARDKLAIQMKALSQKVSIDAVFGCVHQFISEDVDDSVRNRLNCPDHPIAGFIPGTMLIRKKSFLKIGYFQTSWRVGEFIDWYLKAVECGLQMTVLPDILLERRLHNTNQGILKKDARTDYVRILKAALDRRRQSKALGAPCNNIKQTAGQQIHKNCC